METSVEEIYDFEFLNEAIGFAANNEVILKTIDGGITWNEVSEITVDGYAVRLHFSDENNGILFKTYQEYQGGDLPAIYSKIATTTDAGNSWTEQVFTDDISTGPLYFVTPDTGFLTSGSLVIKFVKD